MKAETKHGCDIDTMEKVREPTKKTYDKFGRERIVKISELCQHCPNSWCEGWYRIDAPSGCFTFHSWKEGRLTLEEAVKVKQKQHGRHERTDKVRDQIYGLLEGQCYSYEDRRMAGSVASDIVKGTPVEDALKQARFYLDKKMRGKIYELVSKIRGE